MIGFVRRFIAAIVFCLYVCCGFSQTNAFSEHDKEEFKERVGQMLDVFQKRLNHIANKNRSLDVRRLYVKQALNMFLGNGEAYTDPDGYQQPAVTMEVVSLRNKIPRKQTLKRYLNNLIDIKAYANVEIRQAQTYYVSDWRQQGQYYVATATIYQEFIGYVLVDGKTRPRYRDVTSKTIKIYLVQEEDIEGKKWVIKFGDISVKEVSE